MDEEQHYLRVLDDQAFDIVASFALEPQEMACSLCSTQVGTLSSICDWRPALYWPHLCCAHEPQEMACTLCSTQVEL